MFVMDRDEDGDIIVTLMSIPKKWRHIVSSDFSIWKPCGRWKNPLGYHVYFQYGKDIEIPYERKRTFLCFSSMKKLYGNIGSRKAV